MSRFFLLCLLVFSAATGPLLGAPSCNDCKDLPFLFKELMEQEYLRDQFDSYVKQSYYPPTVGQMYDSVTRRFNDTFYSAPAATASAGANGAVNSTGGAAYGTRTWLKSCDLVEYVKNNKGEQVLDDKKNPVVRPITPKQLRAKECKAVADHVLRHEGHHQKSCRETQSNGTSDLWQSAEFVAKDEVKAYQEGIASLRDTIAKLAKQCNWDGSVRKTKPDGTSVVPTKEQIEQLKNNARKTANALRKAKR
jgi:polyhydroxyalkanoate synthesis regulator phasin